jgi:amino acid transporter/nucleotide-binding universal stress UspA family protein
MRSLGLLGSTGIGVGAIVGGGILVLAGVAFRSTGPAALVAFALNGLVAFLTALSFAEMSAAFPESGGAYLFAKKLLNVRAAFAIGWVLWFAYIVAGVLYALGFAEYAVATLAALWPDRVPEWVSTRPTARLLALLATAGYSTALIRKASGGAQWVNWAKLLVFAVLIGAGLWALMGRERGEITQSLTPFFSGGAVGLAAAMGFTFIALQGFEVIAGVAGEVRRPATTIPRAMLLSLGLALIVYLPLIFVTSTAGVPSGQSITAMSERNPETVMADAALNYLGPTGFWLVMVAALLSTLSALQANILVASRVALTMARDRTLPAVLRHLHATRKTPVVGIYATTLALVTILFVVPNVAAAGAAASLIFLISFALAHLTSYLARRRSQGQRNTFRTPLFPLVPVLGGTACAVLAVFQTVAVPIAGIIVLVWLGFGGVLYLSLFSTRAQVVDAFEGANDPSTIVLRGQSPVVLVPIANPENAPMLVSVASALAPPEAGRVVLMNVVQGQGPSEHGDPVASAQQVLGQALRAAMDAGHRPQALLSVSDSPWTEIQRVAREYRCESLLLGRARLEEGRIRDLEQLMDEVPIHVAFLLADAGWSLDRARRILVPIAGRSGHYALRARVIGSLCREAEREVTWLRVVPKDASEAVVRQARRGLEVRIDDVRVRHGQVIIERDDDPRGTILRHAQQADLMILGLHGQRGRRRFGTEVPRLVRDAPCATLIISSGD